MTEEKRLPFAPSLLCYCYAHFFRPEWFNSSPKHGFLYCVIAITVVYAAILPLILLVPKELIANADGEPSPEDQAEELEETVGMEPA
jgi:hypothetical protein